MKNQLTIFRTRYKYIKVILALAIAVMAVAGLVIFGSGVSAAPESDGNSPIAAPELDEIPPINEPELDGDAPDETDYCTVTFDGDVRGGTLWTLQVPKGASVSDTIEAMEDPEAGWARFFAEMDEDGKHYRVDSYSKIKQEDESSSGPFPIIINESTNNRFILNSPVTEDITVYARWNQRIDEISVTLDPPKCGEEVYLAEKEDGTPGDWNDQVNNPRVSIPEDAEGYELLEEFEGLQLHSFWVNETDEYPIECYMEGGETYYGEACFEIMRGYYVDDTLTVKMENANLVANYLDEEDYILFSVDVKHDLTEVPETAAGCTTEGNKVHFKCTGCDELFSDAEATQNISREDIRIPAVGHDWGEWKVTKEPTATEEGERTRVCKHDPSHVETEKIPATGNKAPGQTTENKNPGQPSNNASGKNGSNVLKTSSPKTGDETALMICLGMLMISALGVMGIRAIKK